MGKKIIAMMIFLSSTASFGQQSSWEIQQRFDRENEYLDLKIRESKCMLYGLCPEKSHMDPKNHPGYQAPGAAVKKFKSYIQESNRRQKEYNREMDRLIEKQQRDSYLYQQRIQNQIERDNQRYRYPIYKTPKTIDDIYNYEYRY